MAKKLLIDSESDNKRKGRCAKYIMPLKPRNPLTIFQFDFQDDQPTIHRNHSTLNGGADAAVHLHSAGTGYEDAYVAERLAVELRPCGCSK
jgi:hypothetical protein